MSPNITSKELLDELPRVGAALNQARTNYLDADAAFDKRGSALEKTVIAEVDNYRDPENKRAKVVRERAAAVAADIQRFPGLRASLATDLALLLVQMQMKIKSFETDVLTFPTGTAVDPKDPLGEVRAFLKDANKKQATQVLLVTKAILIGMKVVNVLNVATNLIEIRQGKLEAYLDEVLTVNVDKAIDSVEDIVKAEIREEAYKQILEAAAKVVGVAVETVLPVVKIATITTELYLNLKRLKKQRYGRAAVDDMLDLSDQIRTETEAFEKDLELFGYLGDAISREKAA